MNSMMQVQAPELPGQSVCQPNAESPLAPGEEFRINKADKTQTKL